MARLYLLAWVVALLSLANSSGEGWNALTPGRFLRDSDAGLVDRRFLGQNSTVSYPLAACTKYLVFGANAKNVAENVMGPGVVAVLYKSIQSEHEIAYVTNFAFPESRTEDYLLNISVAVDDSEVVVVGIPNYENGGVVAIYSKDEDEWGLLQTITALTRSKEKFGLSVGISGSTVVIGDGVDMTFIFERRESSGRFSYERTLPGDAGNVDIKGDLLVVGYKNLRGGRMARLYEYSIALGWVEVYAPRCPDCRSNKDHGFDVAISPSTVAVSTYVHNQASNSWSGYVYILDVYNGTWYVDQTIESNGLNGNFGKSVSAVDRCVLIGAPFPIKTGHVPGGEATIYAQIEDEWTLAQDYTETESYMAEFVSIGGDGSDEYPYVAYLSSSSNEGVYYVVIENNGGEGICNY